MGSRCASTSTRRSGPRWEVPVAPVSTRPEDAYADYAIRPLTRPGRLDGRPEGARLVFAEPDHPDERRVFDGRARLGWRGHDAGLLRPESAVAILLRLLARDGETAGRLAVPPPVRRRSAAGHRYRPVKPS